MRILYAETTAYYPSSAHFLEALHEFAVRGDGEFKFLDEAEFIKPARSLAHRIAGRVYGRRIRGHRELNRALVDQAVSFAPDLVLVGKGSCYTAEALRAVKRLTGATLVNWATDDPFNRADRSRDLLESIQVFDLYVCTKRAMMPDVIAAGCANAAFVMFGYKPGLHFPEAPATDDERRRFTCDVMFAGGCDRDRAPYFRTLMRAMPGLKLNLYGGYWDRAGALRAYARGMAIGRDYRLAVAGAKICVNLVRRANRDDHVMRTFEIPACAGFMLTERSPTHGELFTDNETAAFFGSPEEFVAKVSDYLGRDPDRARIAQAGYRKITGGAHTYADRLGKILDAARPLMAQARKTPGAHAPGAGFESNG